MNASVFRLVFLSATLLTVAPSFAAAGGHADPACKEQRKARMLARFDANKDGQVDDAERDAARAEHHARALAQFDKNKDGVIGKDERGEMMRAKAAEHFRKLDKNGDSQIARDEVDGCSRINRHFDKVDADGSGTVTWSEFEQAAKQMLRHKRGHKFRQGGGPAGESDPS